MDVRATRHGVPAVALWGAVGVLAWATLSVLFAGGSAHADDQEEGPLDGLTSLVSNTVSAVTAPVAPIVTQVVAPVVTQVVAPVQQAVPPVVAAVTKPIVKAPVVEPVVAPVVQAVTETATSIVEPVTDVLTDSPVSQITDPVLDTVAGIPVVGGLVTDLGVISAVDDIIGIVDDTTALLGNVTNATVPPVLEALDPTTPTPGGGPDEGSGATVEPVADAPDAVAAAGAVATSPRVEAPFLSAGTPQRAAFDSSDGTAGASDDATPVPPGPAPSGSPLNPAVPASSSAGSGGGSGASPARLSDVDSSPLGAGERTSGATDDALPASPVADTDVSPD